MKRLLNLIFKPKSDTSETLNMSAIDWGELFKSDPEQYQKKLVKHVEELRRLYS